MGSMSLEMIYVYVLIICAVLAIVLFVFGDVFHFDGPIDPVLIVPWIAFVSLVGYLGEKYIYWNRWGILFIGILISTILIFLMNFYIIMPLRNAESTISMSEKDMEGRKATVITTIPVNGMGEIKMSNVSGSINRPAALYNPEIGEIKQGTEVLIIEIRERVCYVTLYQENFI